MLLPCSSPPPAAGRTNLGDPSDDSFFEGRGRKGGIQALLVRRACVVRVLYLYVAVHTGSTGGLVQGDCTVWVVYVVNKYD